jgi:hypothetical protein
MSVRDYIRRITGQRDAFRACFLGGDGKPTNDGAAVLTELRRFCYGNKPTIKTGPQGIDPLASVAAAARQEVYFRVLAMLNLDDSDLQQLYKLDQQGESDAS